MDRAGVLAAAKIQSRRCILQKAKGATSAPFTVKNYLTIPESARGALHTPLRIIQLENQLETELNLARRGLRGVDQAGALDGLAVLIEDGGVVGGR